jgi:acyl dehydratase
VLGVGVDELRWIAPVYPGDSLRVKGEVLELLPDPEGKPRGRMRARISTINQNGAVVMTYIANLSLVSRRYLEQVQPTGSQAAFRANM